MKNSDHNERLSRLETTMEGVHAELSDIRSGIKSIQESQSRSKETNWSVIFSGLAIVGALYAASIRPLEKDIMRQEKGSTELALAVIVKEEKIQSLRTEIAELKLQSETIKDEFKQFKVFGTPVLDKRISLLEESVKEHNKKDERNKP